jgi:hypothetical protein
MRLGLNPSGSQTKGQSPQFERSLSEAKAWCGERLQWADPEISGRADFNLKLCLEAGELFDRARERANREWPHPKADSTPEWDQAMALLNQVRNAPWPLRSMLWSDELKPRLALDEFCSTDHWHTLVTETVSNRSKLLGQMRGVEARSEEPGRLLLNDPCENLADGAAEFSSSGFFDAYNVPPWDTWVEFRDRTLVCWVPVELVPLAEMGIDANPEQCIRWAEEGASG